MNHPPDIAALLGAFDAAEQDARTLVTGLDEALGTWRAEPGSWSVAECLDHLASGNRVYLRAMEPAAQQARTRGRRRRNPAVPGLIGRWFVRTFESPVRPRYRLEAPRTIRPRPSPSLGEAAREFFQSQDDVRAFIRQYADIDLARVRFPNPFVRAFRFSLATGLHVLAAHERRHLWQAWRVREASTRAPAAHQHPNSTARDNS
jgi:DinB superfamily